MKNRLHLPNPSFAPVLRGMLVMLASVALAQPEEGSSEPQPAVEEVAVTATRLDVVPGSTVLLPLIPGGARLDPIHGPPEGWVPTRVPEVWIAGHRLDASAYRLDGRVRADLAADAWLPLPRQWTATSRDEARIDPGGDGVSFWVLAVELPERPIARELRVGGRSIPIHWLAPVPARTDIARLPLLEAPLEARRRLGERLRREAIDPFRRWRCSIIADRFTSHALWGERPALEPFDDPVLEAAARGAEVRARAAIEAARRIDPDLAAALLSALTAVVRTSEGHLLPVWPSDESGTAEVFASLLDPARRSGQKRADVEVWLDRIPDAVAWVVSDQGAHADLPHGATIGVANLTDREVICSAAVEGESATNAARLLAHRSMTLRTPITPNPAQMAGRVIARVGTRAYPLTVLTATPSASPPGIELGPLLPDWAMITWLGPGAPKVDLGSAASGRLYAEARQPGSDEPRRWRIFVEARRAGGAGAGGDVDTIRVWLGPRGLADAVITLREEGGASIDAGSGPEPFEAEHLERDDGWAAIVSLPRWAIGEDGVVAIGVDRVDGRGVRSAWPRPMIPGQGEPGRLRVDLTGWSVLDGE